MKDIDPDATADFFALVLILGALVLAAALAGSATRRAIRTDAVRLATVVAGGAVAGSLYFSEVADFVPCEMCWIQRIAMYPIVVVGIVALVRGDRAVLPSIGALAALGLVASTYHVGIQLFPDQSSFCDVANPCSSRLVEGLGWMTIPQMAGVCFAVILALSIVGTTAPTSPSPEETS